MTMPEEIHGADDAASTSGKTDWAKIDAMTDEEAEAAALADPDAPPLPEGRTMRRMSRARRVRFKLGLSQPDFADRYGIPLATLIAWERHELDADAVALAYLDAIAGDPDAVAKALMQGQQPKAAE